MMKKYSIKNGQSRTFKKNITRKRFNNWKHN